MSTSRDRVRGQIFWEGGDALSRWYAYANRSPQLYGHAILASDDQTHDVCIVPAGFEAALTRVISILLKWAEQHKAPGCLPVFYRMNIAAEQFRVHLVPVSPQEVAEATASLTARIPRQAGNKGGFLHYLGARERLADKRDAAFREVGGDEEATRRLMEEGGIPSIIEQLRAVATHEAR